MGWTFPKVSGPLTRKKVAPMGVTISSAQTVCDFSLEQSLLRVYLTYPIKTVLLLG